MKELDIVKFIRRQRQNTLTAMALLNGRQKYIIDKLSQLTMRESSNFEEASCDNEFGNTNLEKSDLVSSKIYLRGLLAS